MKRILVYSTADFLPPTGGAEIAFAEIARRLPEHEFDLFCARLDGGKPRFESRGNINIYRIGFGCPRLDKLLLATIGHLKPMALHRKRPYRLVWSVMASYGAFSAVRIKKRLKVPFLLTLQEGDPFDYIAEKTRFVKKSFREIFSMADGLQAISTYLFEWGRKMGFCGQVAAVVPNGVDLDNFSKPIDAQTISEARSSFGFPEKALVMITASRLELKNGISDVIKAMKLLPENVCFVICGLGALEEELKRLVEESGLAQRVKFAGLVKHDRLPLLLKASDLFIRPSLSEGLGNSFLEAMACRTLVVATPVGGITDFLDDERTGFYCRPNDPQSIASAIVRILKCDSAALEAVKQAASDMVTEKYQWPQIARKLQDIINSLINDKKNNQHEEALQ